MDDIFFWLQLAALLAVIFFAFKLIYCIFVHYVYSRIFSILLGIAGIVISIVNLYVQTWVGVLVFPLFYFQYLFFVGPSAFDEYWDGTVTITLYFDKDDYEIKENFVQMFAVHTAIALVVGLPFNYFWAVEAPIVRFIPSALILLITVIGFVRQIINGFDEY